MRSKSLMAVGAVLATLAGGVATSNATPALSTNPADFPDLTTVADFTTLPAASSGTEITDTGLGVTFSGGMFVIDLSFLGGSGVSAGNFEPSLPLAPSNPIAMTFSSDVTQVAFLFQAVDTNIIFGVSRDGGTETILPLAFTGGIIGIVDPAGFDQVRFAVPDGANALLLDVLAFGGTPIPEPSTVMLFAVALLGIGFVGQRGRCATRR